MTALPPLTNRPLGEVKIQNLQLTSEEDGWWASVSCYVSLQSPNGDDDGPGANLFFGAKVEPDTTLQAASKIALTRAHELLARLGSFSPDELVETFEKTKLKPSFIDPAKET